jgi:hypothetical protein
VEVCLVAVGVVYACLVACVWIVVKDARRRGRVVRRWPLYLLAVAATLAVVFAAEGGC